MGEEANINPMAPKFKKKITLNLLGKYCKNNIIGQIEEKKEMHDKKQSVARIFDVDSCSNRAPKGTRTGTIIQEIPSNPPEDGSRVVTLSACHAEKRTPLTHSYKKKKKEKLNLVLPECKISSEQSRKSECTFQQKRFKADFLGGCSREPRSRAFPKGDIINNI